MVVALNPKLKTLVVASFDQVHRSHPDHDHSARTGLKVSGQAFPSCCGVRRLEKPRLSSPPQVDRIWGMWGSYYDIG